MLGKWCCAFACAAVAIRLLLVPAYRSTDFEVHRNWLAITHSLPVSKWYTDATSQWTLDYPPFFAWFEWALSHVAKFFDANMLIVQNLDYASPRTILFQRLSVIATDVLVLFGAAYALARCASQNKGQWHGLLLFCLIVGNAGLLIVDHVHFQYNGMLIGLLLWSIHLMQQGHVWAAGALFAVLLCMKHLFLFCAPVFFVHILRHWCTGNTWQACTRVVIMGGTVVGIVGLAVGPFLHMGQAAQLVNRLFPFGRGLTHAYWAANFWALYSGADKVLAAMLPWLVRPPGTHADTVDAASGLVGVAHLRVLPMVPPWLCAVLVLLAILPAAASLWRQPHPERFAGMVAYSCMCGFWFGYHVHEKAVLPVLVTLTIPAIQHRQAAQDFLVLSCAALYGLLPLLFRPQEYPIKLLLVVSYWWAAEIGMARIHGNVSDPTLCAHDDLACAGLSPQAGCLKGKVGEARDQGLLKEGGTPRDGSNRKGRGRASRANGDGSKGGRDQKRRMEDELGRRNDVGAQEVEKGEDREKISCSKTGGGGLRKRQIERLDHRLRKQLESVSAILSCRQILYIVAFVPLEMYCSLLHPLLLGSRLPFLPLMLTSMYCALGLGYVYVSMLLGLTLGHSYI